MWDTGGLVIDFVLILSKPVLKELFTVSDMEETNAGLHRDSHKGLRTVAHSP